MKFRNTALLCASVALLTACGGGGSSSSAPPPTGGGGATPTPAPAPVPTPTYTAFDNLTGDQAFASSCSVLEENAMVSRGGSGATFLTGFATHTFAASTQTWTFDPLVFTPSPGDFGPANLVPNAPAGLIAYERPNTSGLPDSLFITQAQVQGIEFGFTRALNLTYSGQTRDFNCVFGVPTVPADTFPLAGERYSNIAFIGTATRVDLTTGLRIQQYDLGDSVIAFSADLDALSAVTLTASLRGREIRPDGSLSATVTEFREMVTQSAELRISPSTAISLADPTAQRAQVDGRLTPRDGTSAASLLSGWFFGPRAEEAGFAFFVEYDETTASKTERLIFNGLVLAKR